MIIIFIISMICWFVYTICLIIEKNVLQKKNKYLEEELRHIKDKRRYY